jgi:MFS family permease
MKLPPAFKHRRFVLLWLGLFISITGSQMQLWSLFWHISTLSKDPIAVSGIGAARILPIVIFALIGGVVADLYDRRKVMFLTQTSLAAIALVLAALTFSGTIQLWHIYLLTALQATAISFDLPARQAIIPNLISDKADLPSAFSMQSIAFDLGAIIGPALSGIVIASLGQAYTYVINAVSFGAVLIALFLIGKVEQEINPQARARGVWQPDMIREGIRFIFSKPILVSTMLLDFFATFWSSANTLLPYVAQNVLHVGAVQYGWLSAGQSIGAVSMALVISQRPHIRRQGPLLLGAVTLFGLATILFGLSKSFWLTLAALAVLGAGDAVSTILRNTIRQLATPDHLRGRMVSVSQIFFQGGPQLGEIEAGLAAQAFGVPAAIVIGGIGCVLSVGFVAGKWKELRQFDLIA